MRTDLHRQQWLFWGLLALILLFNLPRLLQTPTAADASDAAPVIISEFVARNQSGLVDDEGDHVDWIELYNRSTTTVNLEGWSLTDNPALPDKWRLPAWPLPPGHYLVVYASGKNGVKLPDTAEDAAGDAAAQPILHTNFRLNGDQGFLALYPPTTRRFVETLTITYGPQQVDCASGRLLAPGATDDQRYHAFTNPTPGGPNDLTTVQPPVVAPVTFSQPHGLYDEPLLITLATPATAAQIWYTTDGTEPTPDSGQRYTAPIPVTTTTVLRATATAAGYLSAPITTQSYLFPAAVLTQPADPPGMPATWGTHRITFGGGVAGEPVQADYAMDPRIAQDPSTQPLLLDGLRSLPSLSLVLPPTAFAELYSDPQRRGVEAEYAASVELIPATPDTAAKSAITTTVAAEIGFQRNAGLRIQGGAGRWEYMPKHSFRLFFKAIYGATKLEYQFFPDSPVTAFDTLILRAGVDRSFAGHPDTADLRQTTYTRDAWLRATQRAVSGIGVHGRFVHLYINGLYWGLYEAVERPDASFAAAYYGGDKEEWAAASHGGPVSGLLDRFNVLLQLAQAGGLHDPEKYATMLEFIDPVQFSDYLIINWYAGNSDWPANNWYANVQYPAGRNLFFAWDGEQTWDDGAQIHLGPDWVEGAPFPNVIKLVFLALMENADFRLLFADRLYQHLQPGGALSEKRAVQRWQAITAPLTNAIVAESARWGDARYAAPITHQDWQQANAAVLTQMQDNGTKLLNLARYAGYLPRLSPPQFSPAMTTFADQLAIGMAVTAGKIYYTTDGSDPRLTGSSAIAPTAHLYQAPLLLTESTVLKARTRHEDLNGHIVWSALQERAYRRANQHADVRITELMYHAPGGADYEFLELKNVGELPAKLDLAYFEGIEYRFASGAQLAPGAHWLLVRDFRKFRERYTEAEINGVYTGELSNYGEPITLYDRNGRVITQVTYQPDSGWPVTAAGQGDAVVLTDLAADPNLGSSWRASAMLYGSPGADEP